MSKRSSSLSTARTSSCLRLHLPLLLPALLLPNHCFAVHVRNQQLRNFNSSIFPLIILQNRQIGPPHSQPAAIQCVQELAFLRAGLSACSQRLISNVRPPRLECLEIRAGRNLPVEPLSRQPHLQVIRLRRRESH